MRTLFRLATLCALFTLINQSAYAKPGRAVSLTVLAEAMKSGQLTEQAESLCGITRVTGYVIDRKSGDVVMVGAVDPNLPALHLDDFVVALRNAWILYTRTEGHTRYYSDPGCSIDPDPRVLGQLRDLRLQSVDLSDVNAVKAASDQWRKIGRQPQNVRVMGVPFDSRFAKTMVDADYYMKRLVDGSVKLDIPGFSSLSDLHTAASRDQIHGRAAAAQETSMNRFWFSPGEVTYEAQDRAIVLKSCSVRLLTEEEYLTSEGVVSGMGRPDPLAGAFARSFTEHYDQIAAQRPVYRRLQTLFAFVAIARLMKEDHAERVAPGAFGYLLKGYKVPTAPVSRQVNGLTSVNRIDEVVNTAQGRQTITFIQSSCGGVSMSVRPRRVNPRPKVATRVPAVARPTTAAARKQTRPADAVAAKPAPTPSLASAVLGSRKSSKSLSWDVQVD